MNRRVFTAVLIAFCLTAVFPYAGTAQAESGGRSAWEYIVYEDGTAGITACPDNQVNLQVPSVIDGLTVTRIENSAFAHDRSIETAAIPDTVTSIGDYAFNDCTALRSISIPKSVTDIGNYVFDYCTGLAEITVDADNPVYTFTHNALYRKDTKEILRLPAGLHLTSFEIPQGVVKISMGAFNSCSDLLSLQIPDSVAYIGDWAFTYCYGIRSLQLSKNVSYIGSCAFMGMHPEAFGVDPENTWFSFRDGALYRNDTNEIAYVPSSMCSGTYTIPEGVTGIWDGAFGYCHDLTEIKIPAGVSYIGWGAFYECENLEKVRIPVTVSGIRDYAFFNCTSLKSINFTVYLSEIGEFSFYGSPDLTVRVEKGCYGVIYCNEHQINYAYYNETETFPDWYNSSYEEETEAEEAAGDSSGETQESSSREAGVSGGKDVKYETNGDYEYYSPGYGSATVSAYLGKEKNPEIPRMFGLSFVTSIGELAFYDTKVESVTIPDSVTSVMDDAFYYCTRLKSVNIPKNVNYIGNSAFVGCQDLARIDVDPKNNYYAFVNNALYRKDEKQLVCVPAGLKLKTYEIPYGITGIGYGALSFCEELEYVSIPRSVKTIDGYAFFSCRRLEDVVIPEGVVSIGEGAFAGCRNLNTVKIPESVSDIAEDAFADCRGLTVYVVKGSYAENYCSDNGMAYLCYDAEDLSWLN